MSDAWDVAIVGMAGRFPGANDVAEFWNLILEGRDTISRFPAAADNVDPNFVGAKGALDGAAHFDAAFFGIDAAEARQMDPQHRVFLECAWHALEDGGCDPFTEKRIGVFAAARLNTFALRLTAASETDPEDMQFITAQDKDFLSSRVAYHLGLTGPALTVQSACSSSLVAVSVACQALLTGQCDAAIAGGVRVSVPLRAGYRRTKKGVLSQDGYCRPFDADASGTVFSDGVGALLLRPLEQARQRGDRIYATIRSIAVNNDGAERMSFTAPSAKGQAAAVADALARSGVERRSVEYIECHGTGTLLGDPIEVEGLSAAFGPVDGPPWCSLGSVKANIGHLSAAAGVASLIKASLALYHRKKPPQANFSVANPALGLEGSAFKIDRTVGVWSSARPSVGVSSFGFGGTNAHAILSADLSDVATQSAQKSERCVVYLSAHDEGALAELVEATTRLVEQSAEDTIAEIAAFSRTRRAHLKRRTALVLEPFQAPGDRVVETISGDARVWGAARAELSVIIAPAIFSDQTLLTWVDADEGFREAFGEAADGALSPVDLSASEREAAAAYAIAACLLGARLRPARMVLPQSAAGAFITWRGAALGYAVEAREILSSGFASVKAPPLGAGQATKLFAEIGDGGPALASARRGVQISTFTEGAFDLQVAKLWSQGAPVDKTCQPLTRAIADAFPRYPFTRVRHWPETLGECE